MTFPVRATGTMFKHTQLPVTAERVKKKASAKELLRVAYAAVDARDGDRDRVTGQRVSARSTDPKIKREHHHIRSRGAYPELINEPSNIILVSSLTHSLLGGRIGGGLIVCEGLDATLPNKLRFHWRPEVPAEQRIIRIKSRRKTDAT